MVRRFQYKLFADYHQFYLQDQSAAGDLSNSWTQEAEVSPGSYRARLYCGNLDALSEDGLNGDDHYKVVLWLAAPGPSRVLRQRANPSSAP